MRPRLLLTYLKPNSFVRDDIDLLGERYDVRLFPFELHGVDGTLTRARALRRLAAEQWAWLRAEASGADVILSWFADYHAVLPVRAGRSLGVPSAVILGGFDAIHIPELDYGVYGSRWRAPLARYVVRNTDLLLPVSGSLIASVNRFTTWPELREQGVRAHVPGCETPYAVVPTGYEPEAWPLGPAERGRTVVTVGLLESDRTLWRKGVDLLFEAARVLPDVRFTVVGVPEERQAAVRAQYRPPPNVDLLGLQPRERLPELYGAASIYLQLSRAEGMPNVICEAMLCGCIPVGSRVFGIPDAVGPAGELVEAPEPARIADAIEAAFRRAPGGRQAARDHILQRFSREHRRLKLFGQLEALAAKARPSR
jgi:glycosyltransferase involved in cell wall biosynthesis